MASRTKLRIEAIETPNTERDKVTFTFNRPLTSLEMQGLTTIVRQSIAS